MVLKALSHVGGLTELQAWCRLVMFQCTSTGLSSWTRTIFKLAKLKKKPTNYKIKVQVKKITHLTIDNFRSLKVAATDSTVGRRY